MFKKGLAVAMAAMMAMGLLAGCGSDTKSGEGSKQTMKVGIVQLVEHPALDAARKGFEEGLASRGFKDKEKITIDFQNAQADQSNLNTIAQRFISEKDNLILAIATPAAQAVANKTKDIPIVATAVTDFKSAKLVQSNDKPATNVTGTTDMVPIGPQLDLMLKILPNVKTIGVIYTSSEVNSQIQVDALKKAAAEKGLKVVEGTVSNVNDIQQVAQNLVNQGVQVIYTPTDNIVASAMANLVSIADNAKVPVFAAEENMTKSGGLATLSINYYKLGYQAGLMAADILEGKAKPADMAIQGQKDLQVIINKKQADKLGISVPEALLKDSKVI